MTRTRARRTALGAVIALAAVSIFSAARSPSLRASFSAGYKAFRDPSLLEAPRPAPAPAPAGPARDSRTDMQVLLDAQIASEFERATDEDLDDPEGRTLASLALPDLRVPITRRTMRYVRFFARTEPGRAAFLQRFRRAGSYRNHIEHALREAGLPEDLVWLAAVESGFDPRAISPAGAAGLWQFMPETGAVYGLYQSPYVDDRRSIVRATTAAVAHLRDLYERFGRWDLALAAYNAGHDGVLKAMDRALMNRPPQDRNKPIEFSDLAEASLLPDETANYVPQIVAFGIVAANRSRFGLDALDLAPAPPLEFGELAFPEGTRLRTIARAAGISTTILREYNPELLRDRLPPSGGDYLVHLPADRVQRTMAAFPAYLENEVLGPDETDVADPATTPPTLGAPPALADALPRRPSDLGHNRLPEFSVPGDGPGLLPVGLTSMSALGTKLPLVMVGGGLGWQRPGSNDPLGVTSYSDRPSAGIKGRELAIEKQLGFLDPARASSPLADPFERFALTSGVSVLLRQDAAAPRVAITLRIAGSESPVPASGASSADPVSPDLEAARPEIGFGSGEVRHTITVAPRDVEMGIELAAARLRLLLSEASDTHLAEQRRLASEPRRRALAETPYGPAYVTLADTLFPPGHPLAGTVLGAREDAAVTRDLLLTEALRQERSASRASITLVGDVNRASAQRVLESLLADVGSPLADAPVPPHPQESRVTVEQGVPSPRTLYGWIAPPEGDKDEASMRVAMEILAGPKHPRLDRALKEEQALASLVKGALDIGPRASVVTIEIAAAVPHDAAEVERRLDAELEAMAAAGPTSQEVGFAKGMIKLRLEKELSSASGPIVPNAPRTAVSARIRKALAPGSTERLMEALDHVTPATVKAVVRRTLTRTNRVVVTTVPRGGAPEAALGTTP